MQAGAFISLFELSLNGFYEVINILLNAIIIPVEDPLSCVDRLEIVGDGERIIGVILLFGFDFGHVEIGLAETNTGFSDGNDKKEKDK